jgi:hypothetical protein
VRIDPVRVTGTADQAGSAGTRASSPTNAQVITTLAFDPRGTGFWSDLSDYGLDVHFASATCGNDVIDGAIDTPEPGTYLLVGLGLLGLARFRRK